MGFDATSCEAVLRDIFDVAKDWNAVILLDEADVFLEARTNHDLQRNALVSTFLQTLEYQDTVIFLTTNRVSGKRG
jgi:SpoVK/Ycf46/Vps4 family AAA+-type ATPase